jgi:hypothetical protein
MPGVTASVEPNMDLAGTFARVAATPARMIERHEDHDNAAQGVDGREAGAFYALRMISRQWQGHLA